MKIFTAKYFINPSHFIFLFCFSLFLIFKFDFAFAQKTASQNEKLFAKGSTCNGATAQRELNINNVRTRILNGGDMWWDLSNAKYEIPKVQSGQIPKNSLFSGAIWIGGISNGNLKIAAQTYRQNGNDYFPGALNITTATIIPSECLKYDNIWGVYLTEVDNFRNNSSNWPNPINDIATWPAMGDQTQGEAVYLAPFFDKNSDGFYRPSEGDYPSFNQNSSKNIPDQMMWYIYNDKGNIHSESTGLPIGIEIQTQAFAYATNDEINNTTFYRNKIINRSTDRIDSCIFGQFVDPDLGYYGDDYIECDIQRNLGICYNGDDTDEGVTGYGINPPSVGVNFLEGPKRSDGTIIGLSKFVYYNNDWSIQGNPQNPIDYWNYLNGRWKDGKTITYGGTGRNGTDTASFMYPGTSDPAGRANWTEVTAGNPPGDRRFMMSSGPFSLLPGAVNNITIAVVWARASSGGSKGSFNLLKLASDKASLFFKSNIFLSSNNPSIPLNKNITLFPNPGNEQIHLLNATSDADEIIFYNLAGQKYLNVKLNELKNIDISSLKNGTYIYQILNRSKEVIQTDKWFKN